MDNLIKIAQDSMWVKPDVPSFKSGDTITVTYRIVEGSKERLQSFRGTVIQIKGSGITKMFTIRKISDGIGVERIFPLYSPHIDHIEVNKVGVVRRARIYYLRGLTGKKARIKEEESVFEIVSGTVPFSGQAVVRPPAFVCADLAIRAFFVFFVCRKRRRSDRTVRVVEAGP